MSALSKYMRKARMSKSKSFELPIVETPEDALALAREAAAALKALPEEDRLPLLSDLTEFKSLLDGRMAHLDAELAESREQVRRVQVGRAACGAYARNVVSLEASRMRRRTPCP